MCQCVLFDCWWCNFCGGKYGCAAQYCCLGYWCCAPENFPQEAKCCYCFEKIGWGSNLSCIGGVCCAQDWLMKWSKAQKWRNHLILDHFFYFLIHLIQNNDRQDFSCSFSGRNYWIMTILTWNSLSHYLKHWSLFIFDHLNSFKIRFIFITKLALLNSKAILS